MIGRLRYLRRILASYLLPGHSQLTFWHEIPEAQPGIVPGELGEYYMTFSGKADYSGPLDAAGVPMLDYHGTLGLQYNPIAIAQYGLGNFNRYRQSGEEGRRQKFLRISDWLISHLETNTAGLAVWNHHFDWEYRTPLRAPWYSGLAQGQGISVLVRAYQVTGDGRYLEVAHRAFNALATKIEEGGCLFIDDQGFRWIEEYIVSPPTHILNGFLWATWGVYDYFLATRQKESEELFRECARTLEARLSSYDAGFWSLYEHSGTLLRMIASPFYHSLHIVQLRVMHQLTGREVFQKFADRWDGYRKKLWNRVQARAQKSIFKLLYY